MATTESSGPGPGRLRTLSRHLRDSVPAWRLDMRSWIDGPLSQHQGCEAAACAFGHACLVPEFREAGLRLEWADGARGRYLVPEFQGQVGYAAAAKFFGIGGDEADYVFDPDSYGSNPEPGEVADRLDELAAWRELEDALGGTPGEATQQRRADDGA